MDTIQIFPLVDPAVVLINMTIVDVALIFQISVTTQVCSYGMLLGSGPRRKTQVSTAGTMSN